ncbi:hypothetical protein [Halegenticoccus soli]|uniref:hypothetical protein n=1 Tax=Halegenticoccus soli TaxID=1985678 RepID=UPI001E594EBB|nr:hypothetical protein [Halegenticoccus soli]
MSSPSTTVEEQPTRPGSADDALASGIDRQVFGAMAHAVVVPLRALCFWAAIALPFLYVPLLLDGLKGSAPLVFVGLLSANLVALYVGRAHKR